MIKDYPTCSFTVVKLKFIFKHPWTYILNACLKNWYFFHEFPYLDWKKCITVCHLRSSDLLNLLVYKVKSKGPMFAHLFILFLCCFISWPCIIILLQSYISYSCNMILCISCIFVESGNQWNQIKCMVWNGSTIRVPWCSGSHTWLVIRGLQVWVPPGTYAPRQGILFTVVSLDPGVVNGYRQEYLFLVCHVRL